MKLKTIKEIKQRIIDSGNYIYDTDHLKIEALKDVLGLIDELPNTNACCDNWQKELKKRITG